MNIESIKQNHSYNKYKIAQDYSYKDDDYWEWSVWVEAENDDLDRIDNVIYTLHYTFPDPVKVKRNRENKFKLKTSGWGTFIIYIIINFKDSSVLRLEHQLELRYPDGKINED